jgi:putative hydrolase of the HAD superfamily
MALKAIIFDAGDVLIRTVDTGLRTAWEEKLGLAPGQAEFIVFGGEAGWAYQLGLVGEDEHWHRVQTRLGLTGEDLARFRVDFFTGDRLDTELLAYIGRLRPHYRIGLLSNAPLSARQVMTEKYPILQCFDSVTISAEEGVMKPDARIFHIALERAGVQPGEALFVDDSPRNIEGARALGLLTLRYVDPAAGRRELVRLTGIEDG